MGKILPSVPNTTTVDMMARVHTSTEPLPTCRRCGWYGSLRCVKVDRDLYVYECRDPDACARNSDLDEVRDRVFREALAREERFRTSGRPAVRRRRG